MCLSIYAGVIEHGTQYIFMSMAYAFMRTAGSVPVYVSKQVIILAENLILPCKDAGQAASYFESGSIGKFLIKHVVSACFN